MTFGVTGRLFRDTFVLFDRATKTVWYPSAPEALEAVWGPKKGQKIAFIDKPKPMPLREWVHLHPDTKVLFGAKQSQQRTVPPFVQERKETP